MKTDEQLKIDVMEQLRWEPSVTPSDINVAADDGRRYFDWLGSVLRREMGCRTGDSAC